MGRSGKNLISKLISEAMAFVSNCAGMRAWLEKSIWGSWQGEYNSSQLLVLRSYDSVCAFTALGILLWPAPPCILPALSRGPFFCVLLRQTSYRITSLLPDVGTLPACDIIILEWFFFLQGYNKTHFKNLLTLFYVSSLQITYTPIIAYIVKKPISKLDVKSQISSAYILNLWLSKFVLCSNLSQVTGFLLCIYCNQMFLWSTNSLQVSNLVDSTAESRFFLEGHGGPNEKNMKKTNKNVVKIDMGWNELYFFTIWVFFFNKHFPFQQSGC